MSADNIFDLTKIVAPSNDVKIKKETKIDEEALLENYELIDKEQWKYLKHGTSIRYLRKDGGFRRGGIIQDITISDNDEEILKIKLMSGYGVNIRQWVVNSTYIEKIWAKKEIIDERKKNEQLFLNKISELKEDIELCKESNKQLIKEIKKIKNEQSRIIDIIKKLHKI